MGLEFQDFKKLVIQIPHKHKQIPHFRVPFTFDFYLSITIRTWDTSLGPLSSQFWADEVTDLSQNLKVLRERFHKEKI